MSTTIKVDNNQNNAYDKTPYESYPYIQSHPNNLMTLGVLFGMQPVALEGAKILELGCAVGGNIIPHAINYPKAKFVGVDLSKVQIEQASKTVSDLKLKNIEFYNCSITDIDDNFGKFDYIICHGVISFVPELIRKKIFEVCSKNLSPNGIAYVSYNTLPGWNMIRTIRDMMLYHSKFFNTSQEKVSQSRLFLNFVKDSLAGQTTPYAEILKQESELLSKQPDHYLRHDHLEDENKQYYFEEFMEAAKHENLQYLGDCNLSSMYIGNMPAKVVEQLQQVQDIVRTEQYMDFITNRRFRSSLLVHNSVTLNRSLNAPDIEKFYLTMNITPEKLIAEVKLEDSLESLSFENIANKKSKISTSSPSMKAILYSFAENLNNPLSIEKLVAKASKKLDGNKANEIKTEFVANALRMVLSGHINLTIKEPAVVSASKDKPKVSSLIQYQTSHTKALWVTNNRHEAIGINILERLILGHMSGQRSKTEIIELLQGNFAKGDFNIHKDGQKIEDFSLISTEISNLFDETVAKAAANALLV